MADWYPAGARHEHLGVAAGLDAGGRALGHFSAGAGAALPGARLVMLDLPGNGQRHAEASPWTVARHGRGLSGEMRRQGIAPPYHLLAMSLGAMVATEWARLAPDEVAGCVLINTSMRPFSRFYQRLRPRNYGRLLSVALFTRDPLAVETAVWRLTSSQPLGGSGDTGAVGGGPRGPPGGAGQCLAPAGGGGALPGAAPGAGATHPAAGQRARRAGTQRVFPSHR